MRWSLCYVWSTLTRSVSNPVTAAVILSAAKNDSGGGLVKPDGLVGTRLIASAFALSCITPCFHNSLYPHQSDSVVAHQYGVCQSQPGDGGWIARLVEQVNVE